MIIAIIGNVGSGKSVSAVKQVVSSKKFCFTNFDVISKNSQRIKKEDVIQNNKINWEFWNEKLKEKGEYHIFLDEVHNLIHSRQSMTKHNVLMTQWISQIRKILGKKEKTHIYLISQRIERIDVAFRDLLHLIIYCRKIKEPNKIKTKIIGDGETIIKDIEKVHVIQHYFRGKNCVKKLLAFMDGYKTYDLRTSYVANPYFQFYDSYELIGETAYL